MPLNSSDIIPDMPLGRGVSIIVAHPEGLVALEKPCRILSHPNIDADRKRSLLNASWSKDRERFLWKVGEQSFRLYLLHRLDSATSGVILGCLNPNLARELKTQFSKRKVAKTYHAIVSGIAKDSDKLWRDLLRKRRMKQGLRMETHVRGGSPAETRVTLLATKHSNPKLSLLKLNPLTGRTHQLRVQAAKRHLPIIGDTTYGDFTVNRQLYKASGEQRLFLHASSIHISWIWKGREHKFHAESKLPKIFNELLELRY